MISIQAQTEKILLKTLSVAMVRKLIEEQRNMRVLRLQKGFSSKETAEIIGKNVNVVNTLQNCAFNRLRQVLNRDDERDNHA